jgi:RNA polymerase sigma-70 factor, ECF subfamily
MTPASPVPENPEVALQRAIFDLSRNDPGALDRVFALAYDELRILARARLRDRLLEDPIHTTSLVHEAYIRVRRRNGAVAWESRDHFFAFASKAMRHILVDHARRQSAHVRGGGMTRVTLTNRLGEGMADHAPCPIDLLELDRALSLLAQRDPRLESVVECRFFGGMTAEETAGSLGVSVRTIERDWVRARAYLKHLIAA